MTNALRLRADYGGKISPVNKTKVHRAIIEALRAEFSNFLAISKQTRATGNDPQTKAEGKYDTRSTEENYLADGQAKQAHAARLAAVAFENLTPREFTEEDVIEPGALLLLELPGEKMWFFLGPAAGGLEVTVDQKTVTVITPESPLGRQLAGLKLGGSMNVPQARVLEVH